MGYVSLTVTIVCFILLIIIGETVRKEREDAHNIPVWVAAILGCLIGAFGIGHLIAKDHGGEPIATFTNGDAYKVVSISPVVDDSQTVLVGLRRIKIGASFVHFDNVDLSLRVYRLPRQVVEPITKLRPPIYIKVFRLGDTTAIQPLSELEAERLQESATSRR